MKIFDPKELKKLKKREETPTNGQVTIVGGSDLFHGAPILALKVASRIVDMVYFSSPEPSIGDVAARLKSKLSSFIWVPWEEVIHYIEKSDAVLIGPGMKRWHRENSKFKNPDLQAERQKSKLDEAGRKTKRITERFLKRFPDKKWVIDAGALQVMEPAWIPKDAVLTPNKKEFNMLFGKDDCLQVAKRHKCIIVAKGQKTVVCSPKMCVTVIGGNNGLTKGGTGDVQAGLTVALLAQNPPFLAAAGASFLIKYAADMLYKKVGPIFNADDLADEISKILARYLS